MDQDLDGDLAKRIAKEVYYEMNRHSWSYWAAKKARMLAADVKARARANPNKELPNAIICLCSSYRLRQVEAFLKSALAFAHSAQIIMFFHNIEDNLYVFCKSKGVLLKPFRPDPAMHMQSARYFDFLKFCQSEAAGTIDKVLLTDVRDVVFQADPFDVVWPSDLVLAAEDSNIGDEVHNSRWLTNLYGEAQAKKLADKRIICSGTTIGTKAAMISYLQSMCREIERVKDVHKGSGYDQGALNYLVNASAIDRKHIDYNDSCFATVGETDGSRLTVDRDGIRKNGILSPVLHQYDRHPALLKSVEDRYRS